MSTPFEYYYGVKPDLEFLKTFGSRVCVKRSGDRRAKLDRHDFTGIFLGYTATDQNIVYLDLDSGIVKQSHHATFDEAWYLQPARPPAAQLLYDIGLEADDDEISLSDTEPDGFLPPFAPLYRNMSLGLLSSIRAQRLPNGMSHPIHVCFRSHFVKLLFHALSSRLLDGPGFRLPLTVLSHLNST